MSENIAMIIAAGVFVVVGLVGAAWTQNEQEGRKLELEIACIMASGQIENGHCVVYTKGK